MTKLNIIKVTADGEQCSIDVEVSPESIPRRLGKSHYEDLVAHVAPYYKLMDERLLEMNERILGSNELVRRLPPEAQVAMHHALDVLMGRAPKSEIDQLVKEGQQRRQKDLDKLAGQIAEEEKPKKGPTTH